METYDLAIIGAGPAGKSAAVNAKIRNKKIILFGKKVSKKIVSAPLVDNYLGLPGIKGSDLQSSFSRHLEEMEIQIEERKIDNIFPQGEIFALLSKGDMYLAKSVIITSGVTTAHYLPGEQDLLGKGLGYCATCDGPLYKGKRVALIGYSQEAEEEANYLSEVCEKVYYLPLYKNPPHLKPEVEIISDSPKEIEGEDHVTGIKLANGGSLEVDGVFIIREATPVENLIPGLEQEKNVIKVNRNMETSIAGVYAAGDCTGKPFQIAKSVGEGLVAALNAVSYLDRKEIN